MPDNRPGPPDRKLTLIAPIIIGVALAILLAVAVITRRPPAVSEPPPAPSVPAQVNVPPPPPLALPPPLLGRPQLIQAADQAAAAYAAGEVPAKSKSALIGRAFMLRLPFGCDGLQVAPRQAQAFAEYDAAKKTIRLVARPGDWKGLPVVQAAPEASKAEAVEGFWLPRPWSYSDACPPRRDEVAASPAPPSSPTLGLMRISGPESSRVLRREGRPYEFVLKAPDDDPSMLQHTYHLVVQGRIVGFADGQALRCHAETNEHRPVCLFAVEFERVAFEDATTQKTLAEWRE